MTAFTVWKFETPDGAEQAVDALEGAERDHLIKIMDHAVISWPAGASKPRMKHGRDEAWHDTLLQADNIYRPMIAALAQGIDELGPDDPARNRLVVSRAFMQFILEELHGINDRWAAHRRELGEG